MSLLFSVLFAYKCKNTHHKLALDALRYLEIQDAEKWSDLFLTRIDQYLDGSKAPDDKFKDFQNHVLHVRDHEWGGAIKTAQIWYEKSVTAFRQKDWSQGVYSAGVLSHYVTDPFQPFHTGQSEAETIVHRAAEWTIACSYDQLRLLLDQELGGVPAKSLPQGVEWLPQIIRQGAQLANQSYELAISHYSLAIGSKKPVEGYDDTGRRAIARILGETIRGYALVLGECLKESGVTPPSSPVTIYGVLAAMTVPIFSVTKKMANASERAAVLATAKEVEKTGRCEKTLSADEKVVREAYATEVCKVPVETFGQESVALAGSQHAEALKIQAERPKPQEKTKSQEVAEKPKAKPLPQPVIHAQPPVSTPPPPSSANRVQPQPQGLPTAGKVQAVSEPATGRMVQEHESQFYLAMNMPLEKAPSIGPKTAEKFTSAGIRTVGEFVNAEPHELARKLSQKSLDSVTLYEWQCQARLCCEIPKFRGYMAQILTAIGIQTKDEFVEAEIETLWDLVDNFLTTPEAERLLRGSHPPDLEDLRQWQARAKAPIRENSSQSQAA